MMKKKWYHVHMIDQLSGEEYLVGVKASSESEAECRARLEAEKYWPQLWQEVLGFMSELEAEASGLDEF